MTTKTEQQKRFEAAWHIKWPSDEPFIFYQNKNGVYRWPQVQDTFEGFQLGEASALERAAAEAVDQSAEIERLKGLLTIYFNAQQETT